MRAHTHYTPKKKMWLDSWQGEARLGDIGCVCGYGTARRSISFFQVDICHQTTSAYY